MKIKLILSISILSSVSLISAMSETPDEMLYRALKAGDMGIKLAEKAIKLGANVNTLFEHNSKNTQYTPLSLLISGVGLGHEIKKTVQLLLESGADISIRNKDRFNRNVLEQAKSSLDKEKLLLKRPSDKEETIKNNLEDIIYFIQNNEVISKEKAEKLKKEINEHLLPDISDMVIQYAFLVKKDSDKKVSFLSIK